MTVVSQLTARLRFAMLHDKNRYEGRGRDYWMIFVVLVCSPALASGPGTILDADFGLQKISTGCEFTEGPVVDAEGNLFFSDGPNDRIMIRTPAGGVSVFLDGCGAANGLLLDWQGRLLMCQSARPGGKRAIARRETDGSITTLTASFAGRRYIAPNDLCMDRLGRIYFTDPYYDGDKSQPTSGVYRLDPNGEVTLLIRDLVKPNGIVITPDDSTIYVSDRGTQKLHRYRVSPDGKLEWKDVVYDFSPDRGIDGMALDREGNVYGAAGQGETSGLFVISPDGDLLVHKRLPEFATNVIFGGKDRRDLFVTASTSVYQMRTKLAGAKYGPPIKSGPFDLKPDIAYKTEGTAYELERAKLDLYLPSGHEGPQGFPTLLWFHGGSLKTGDKQGSISKTVSQRLVGEGIAVASANYRLFPRAKYPMYIEDAAAALAWLHQHISDYGGDPDQLFISGHSAGGYLAAMVSLDDQYLKTHGLQLSDLAGSIPISGQIDSHWTVREEREIPRTVRIIDESAPLFHIRADAPPMLTFCGSNDLAGRAARNQVFADALKRAGHPDITYRIIEGRNHGTIISLAGNADDAVGRDIIEFIKSHVPALVGSE